MFGNHIPITYWRRVIIFNMTQHELIVEAVREAVKETVNGKIDKLDKKVTERLDAQDLALKPVIEAFANGKFTIRMVTMVLKALTMVASIVGGIVGLYKIKEYLK